MPFYEKAAGFLILILQLDSYTFFLSLVKVSRKLPLVQQNATTIEELKEEGRRWWWQCWWCLLDLNPRSKSLSSLRRRVKTCFSGRNKNIFSLSFVQKFLRIWFACLANCFHVFFFSVFFSVFFICCRQQKESMETKDVKRNEHHQPSAVASSSSSSLIMRKKNTVSEMEKPGQGKGERQVKWSWKREEIRGEKRDNINETGNQKKKEIVKQTGSSEYKGYDSC